MNRLRLVGVAMLVCGLLGGCSAPSAPAPTVVTLDRTPSLVPVTPAVPPTRAMPLAVTIPAIEAASTLVPTGLNADDTLQVPDGALQASWFAGSVQPGQPGPAVLLGHVDYDGVPGVFGRLAELSPGDEILVDRAGAPALVFVVDTVERHDKDTFPTGRVYGDTTGPELRLITCGGLFDQAAGSYEDNIVVFAHLVTDGDGR